MWYILNGFDLEDLPGRTQGVRVLSGPHEHDPGEFANGVTVSGIKERWLIEHNGHRYYQVLDKHGNIIERH